MKKGKVPIILLIVLLISILSGCIETSENGDKTSENNEAHNFVFTALDGSKKHLSDYRGKIVILDMWAIYCPPCQAVMPELKKIYENYSRDDLEILSINVNPYENAQDIQVFRNAFKQMGIELDWVFGKEDGSISEKYMNEGAIPTLAVFDQKGRLHYRKPGLHVFDEIPYGYPEETPRLAPILEELID